MSVPDNQWSTHQPIRIGMITLALLVLCAGGWAVLTRIEGAIVAPGTVTGTAFHQVVQHKDGGIVVEVVVREGDHVKVGDVLMRLDDSVLRSQRQIFKSELDEILARSARARAERDRYRQISLSSDQTTRLPTDPGLRNIIEAQQRLFEARRASLQEQIKQFAERAKQVSAQIKGLNDQRNAIRDQIKLINLELADQQALLDRGLTQSSRVLSLKRERARLDGRLGEIATSKAQFMGQIKETQIARLRLQITHREHAISILSDLSLRATELRHRIVVIDEQLSKLTLTTHTTGTVYGMKIHTVGAVARPAEPLLYVVPDTDTHVVNIRVQIAHIDQVHPGQRVFLRFSAFDKHPTPVMTGVVSLVSPDVFTDEVTGARYYQAQVIPDPNELETIDQVTLVHGMPVETYFRTEARTPMSYILKPLTTYFGRALREN